VGSAGGAAGSAGGAAGSAGAAAGSAGAAAGSAGAAALGAVTADPPAPVSGPLDPIRVRLSVSRTITLKLSAGAGASVRPSMLSVRPGAPATVSVRLTRAGATGTGRLVASDPSGRSVLSVPWLVRPPDVPPVPIGPLRAGHGRVRFTLGAFNRGDPFSTGTSLRLADKLVLQLIDASGRVARTLTVPGGARGLMPAEYGYALPRSALAALPAGRYRFRAQAWAPRQRTPTTATSSSFRP
jgi:hypothetical protein